MKLIVAGTRAFNDYNLLECILGEFMLRNNLTEIVSGTATGADRLGEQFAKEYNIPIKRFKADWSMGKKAGYLRNKEMAIYAEQAIVFWDGKSLGSKMMIDIMRRYNKPVSVIVYD